MFALPPTPRIIYHAMAFGGGFAMIVSDAAEICEAL